MSSVAFRLPLDCTSNVSLVHAHLLVQTTSTSVLLLSPIVRAQYATRHTSHPEPTVRWADFAFACHALVLSGVTLSQFQSWVWGWKYGKGTNNDEFNNTRPTRLVCWLLLGAGLIVTISIAAAFVGSGNGEEDTRWQWLDVVRLDSSPCCSSHCHASDEPMPYAISSLRLALKTNTQILTLVSPTGHGPLHA